MPPRACREVSNEDHNSLQGTKPEFVGDEAGVRGGDEVAVRHISDSNTSDSLQGSEASSPSPKFSPDVYRLVDLLVELIVQNTPGGK